MRGSLRIVTRLLKRGILIGAIGVLTACEAPQHPFALYETTADKNVVVAIEKAKATLGLFLRNNVQADKNFVAGSAVRVVMPETGSQILWVGTLKQLPGNKLSGILVDYPKETSGPKTGQNVIVPIENIRDWSWTLRDGSIFGAFTVRATLDQIPPSQASALLAKFKVPAVPNNWR